MASLERWRVTLLLDRNPDRQAEPGDWNWSALTETHIEDVSAHLIHPIPGVDGEDQADAKPAFSEEAPLDPLTASDIQRRADADPDGIVHALVAIDLADIVEHDLDWLLDEMGYRAFGRPASVNYKLINFDECTLRFVVDAYPADLLDGSPGWLAEPA